MVKKLLICLVLSVLLIPLYADYPCKKAREKALEMFHSGQYYQAKQLFQEVSSECGKNYQNVDAMLQLCNSALKKMDTVLLVDNSIEDITIRYLSASSSSISFDVFCYGDYDLTEYPTWCKIKNIDASSFEMSYSANTLDTIRSGVIYVVGGNKTIAIILEQAGTEFAVDTQVEEIVVADPVLEKDVVEKDEIVDKFEIVDKPEIIAEPLTLSHTMIDAPSSGLTDYITVSCGKEWNIQHPWGTMYSADRIGNQVRVKILPNKTYSARSDYFYVTTKDDTESIKVYLSQNQASQSTIFTPSEVVYKSAYKKYCDAQGLFEVTWLGSNFLFGSGFEYAISLLRMRVGFVQFNLVEFMIGVDFLGLTGDDLIYAYQPSINFVIPTHDTGAVYLGAGPSIGNYLWFKTEAGYRFHWAKNASTDVFFRYDGMYSIGISIQYSSSGK